MEPLVPNNPYLVEVFSFTKGILIIEGADNWIKFLTLMGLMLEGEEKGWSNFREFRIGGVRIVFASNPKFVKNVVLLDYPD